MLWFVMLQIEISPDNTVDVIVRRYTATQKDL